ncbi:MAG: twin transmembrane helix small protein [Pseudomonadota bacterium]
MPQLLNYGFTITVMAVLCVLVAGLWTMMRGKSANLSQQLMRWRVGLQFIAIIIIMAAFYLRG